jgi:hypothetical protein
MLGQGAYQEPVDVGRGRTGGRVCRRRAGAGGRCRIGKRVPRFKTIDGIEED